jgi:proline iminopeptidase
MTLHRADSRPATSPASRRRARPAPRPPGLGPRLLRTVWSDSRLRWGAALTTAAAYGVVAGLWTPRGPIATTEALAAMVLGALTGTAVGVLLRSRWALLVAPAAFVAVFELVRIGASGPTVDGIHLGSTYGIIALAVGRGGHAVLTLAPMVLGASLGAALARRRSAPGFSPLGRRGSLALWLRRAVATATAVALVAVAAFVARPATTEPVVDDAGRSLPGGVAELTRVQAGDHDLALMIRGRSTDKPVLLFLAGGPGGSELGAMRRHSRALEEDFVVATLDQRGTGKSYDQLDPTDTLTVDRAVSDTLDVTHYLRARFAQDKIYLVGQSWGSLLGVLVVQRQPELFHAFVGAGQMVSPLATDQIFYRDTLAWAQRTGRTDLAAALTGSGPPPYSDMLDYEPALSHEQEVYPYDHSGNSEGSGQMSENLLVEEYTLLEQIHVLGAFLDVFSVLYPQLQDIDLRSQAARLDVPVYLAQGRHEAPARSEPAEEWFALLQAPRKQLVEFDTSGHRPLWEQPARFHEFLTGTVLAETAPAAAAPDR